MEVWVDEEALGVDLMVAQQRLEDGLVCASWTRFARVPLVLPDL